MNKYTVIYTANGRYDSPHDEPISRVDYIQGKTIDEAIDGHIKHLKGYAIRDNVGEPVFLEGHIRQVDIGAGVGHMLVGKDDLIITGVNNDKVLFDNDK